MTHSPKPTLQAEIEAQLATAEPDVEVVLAEVAGDTLRLFIDHPEGVTLGLCERVSGQLTDYRDRYSLEVSSPGADRPLTKPAHFERFVGRPVRARLRPGEQQLKRSVTGELPDASREGVTIAAPDGVMTLPYEQILRCNLVPGD